MDFDPDEGAPVAVAAERVELSDEADPDRLVAAAAELEAEAERLREQRLSLLARARELKQHAELVRIYQSRRVEHKRVGMPTDRRGRDIPPHELEVIKRQVEALQPHASVPAIAEHLTITENMVRTRLERLIASGAVERTGQASGTRYWLKDTAPKHMVDPLGFVCDVGRELKGAFFIQDILNVAPGMSYATAAKCCEEWVKRGTFDRVEVEDSSIPAGKRILYDYINRPSEPVNRRKRAPVEVEVARSVAAQRPRRGRSVAGTGRGITYRSDEVRKFVEQVEAQGLGVRPVASGGSHLQFIDGDQVVGGISNGNMDPRAIANQRAELRRKGYDL
ncbi:hypothetical protein [Candidatus Solirubrobacter pratensis]|uniref:hypothetical protein n=1 Tax=Candidatus Solirubrobacter pratensis TaxID=1298857 RepID=UPI0012DF846C|nr:hypothetical protein [Candidatus Solirubrobacter pratensis]